MFIVRSFVSSSFVSGGIIVFLCFILYDVTVPFYTEHEPNAYMTATAGTTPSKNMFIFYYGISNLFGTT